MNAQLSMIIFGPGTRSAAEKLAEQFDPALKILKGFKRVTPIGDETVGEYGSLSLWESKEDVKTATEVVSPLLENTVSGIAKVPPTRRFFEMYKPKV